MTAEEATRAHECEVRERRSANVEDFPFVASAVEVQAFPGITPDVIAEAKTLVAQRVSEHFDPPPKKRGRPRKVA